MADKEFILKVITPDRVFYEGAVKMVEFNTTEGEIGIYQEHIPMTVLVSPGLMAITEESQVKYAALHAGFAQILPEEITILAEVVEWPEEIDLARAEAAKVRAEERLKETSNETDLARAETALHRAIARIHVVK